MSSPIPVADDDHASLRTSTDDRAQDTSRALSRKSSRASAAVTPRLSSSPRAPSSIPQGLALRRPSSIAPSIPAAASTDLDDLTDEEKARVLRRHLVSRVERTGRDQGPSSLVGSLPFPHSSSTSSQIGDDEPFPVPYNSAGGDITHPIYKWNSAVGDTARRRSISYAGLDAMRDPAFEHIHQPGGFRRNYLMLRSDQNHPGPASGGNGDGDSVVSVPPTNNFIEFLYLYGHFAGEQLEEIEEEDEEDEDEPTERLESALAQDHRLPEAPPPDLSASFMSHLSKRSKGGDLSESTPLVGPGPRGMTLKRSMSKPRTRSMSMSRKGDATVSQAILMMLKSFIGTGVLFLGKAFYNGGLVFSLIMVSAIGLISLYAFSLLVEVKMKIGGSFGDMGGMLYGTAMRRAILFSIAISQIGFVTAYIIFVSSNLNSLVLSFTNCETQLSSMTLVFSQVIALLPLALVRNLARLSFTALIADGFILVGLMYIWGSELSILYRSGPGDIEMWFNPTDYALLVGTAVFSFEGIGLIIPITDAMKEPQKFPKVLTGVMLGLIALFVASGALSYLAFGSSIQPTVIINLPQKSPATQTVQLIYSLAILLSIPIQLFPAVRIMETAIFGSFLSGKVSKRIKWEKNLGRSITVIACAFISWLGSNDLDKFVSFVGCFACLPLCFIYPALLHLKACAYTRMAKIKDAMVFIFGVVVMLFSTVQTVRLALAPSEPPPGVGACA